MLELKEISKEDEVAFCEFEKRYKAECGEEKIPYSLNPKNLAFNDFLKELDCCKHVETLPKGFVLAKYYLIWVDGRIVGGINLRLGTNDLILNYAGHIGYGIAPWERNKGYATWALKKLLIIALNLGMKDFLLTTDLENIYSQKIILSCGGQYEKTQDNKSFYWIHLPDWKKEESAMALVFYENKILATKELIYGKEVVLSCPKGHIENNETHIETAIRECFEETNFILSSNDFIKEVEPYSVQFIDHHNCPVLKTIYPVQFRVSHEGSFKIKEECILDIFFMEIEEFLSRCSYENVKQMVLSCIEK